MKLSLNFVKDYVDIDENINIHDLAEAMTKAGNEYDEAGKLIDATKFITIKIVYTIIKPLNNPYIIPPILLNWLRIGNFAIKFASAFIKIKQILVAINNINIVIP